MDFDQKDPELSDRTNKAKNGHSWYGKICAQTIQVNFQIVSDWIHEEGLQSGIVYYDPTNFMLKW